MGFVLVSDKGNLCMCTVQCLELLGYVGSMWAYHQLGNLFLDLECFVLAKVRVEQLLQSVNVIFYLFMHEIFLVDD